MNTENRRLDILPGTQHICYIISSLFSPAECAELLTDQIRESFQKANLNYPTHYRNNDRYVLQSDELAGRLFQKVKPYLPQAIAAGTGAAGINETWKLEELNSKIRFCRYAAGQYFHRHLDGVYYKSATSQSRLTFMVYLNGADEFEGGKTRFFKSRSTGEVLAEYTPVKGDLIIFDHNVWHDGEALSKGEKFVLRSDIIYSKLPEIEVEMPFTGHLGYIWCLVKLNDHTIVSGGRDTKINCWDKAGHLQKTLAGHHHSILSMARMDDDTFISCSRDKQVIVWRNYLTVHKMELHAAVVLSLCRLTDTTFASGGGDHLIRIATLDGNILSTLNEHTDWVWDLVHLGGTFLASCSEDASIKIWNINQTSSVTTFHGTAAVICLTYHHLSRHIISGDIDGTLTIRKLSEDWALQDLFSYKAHDGAVRTIKIINAFCIATGGEDNKIRIWRFTDALLLAEFQHDNFVQSIEVLSPGKIISASYDGTIKIWDIKDLLQIAAS